MTRLETNNLNMGNAVTALFDNEPQVITDCPSFGEPVTNLKRIIRQAQDIDKKFSTATGGKTPSKYNAEDNLLEDLMPVKSALNALACKTQNEELKALSSESEASLKRLRDAEFLKIAETIKDEAVKYLPQLSIYQITEADITHLQQMIDSYKSAIGGRDTGLSSRSAYRKELTLKLDELNKLFEEELDNLIELLRKKNRLFYDKYQSARGIKDLGKSHKGTNEEGGDSQKPVDSK
jgi:hypothetical protein